MIPKFRAWDKVINQMFIPDSIHFDSKGMVDGIGSKETIFGIEDFELMQSTGMIDENKEEVFQDDIIWFDLNEEYGVVEIDEAKFVIRWQGYVEDLSERIDLLEVAGNIHEHPELLENI